MAHPKRKTSKQRKHKRRTHIKATAPALTTCQNCNATVELHRVCPECGHYKGRLAIEKNMAI